MKKLNRSGFALQFLALTIVVGSACAPLSAQFEGVDYPAVSDGIYPVLLTKEDFEYVGAFTVPDTRFGASTMNYAEGVLEVDGDSMFIVGHVHDDAIAQFRIPTLVKSERIRDLKSSGDPIQAFSTVLDRTVGGNPQGLDQIVGMELLDGSLVVNAIEYYDAPADNTLTTFVIEDAGRLHSSPVSRMHSMQGLARAAGWLSKVPAEWRHFLRASHITGSSSGGPIISRHSVGPSAFAVNLTNDLPTDRVVDIPTRELLGFSYERPLHEDLFNKTGKNRIWTHESKARYGFLVPGTSTYVTIGNSGGHNSGVGYKIEQSDGHVCGGYCTPDVADNYNYYWLWDFRQMFRAGKGKLSPHELKPYEYGVLDLPFQTSNRGNFIGGASYDDSAGLLYVSILGANNEIGPHDNPPVIVAFRIGD